jgi:hypothetical protein
MRASAAVLALAALALLAGTAWAAGDYYDGAYDSYYDEKTPKSKDEFG